jgi:predicted DCC family thiol-disulfide oxidoreductase YuxK
VTPPILLYDGDCAFCQRSARFARRIAVRSRVSAFQDVDVVALHLTTAECEEALRYVDAAGLIYRGHVAVAAFLRDARRPWSLLRGPLLAPGTDRFWSWLYDLVARNRHRLPGGTAACEVEQR